MGWKQLEQVPVDKFIYLGTIISIDGNVKLKLDSFEACLF